MNPIILTKYKKNLLIVWAVLCLSSYIQANNPPVLPETATVTVVYDGDTIKIRAGEDFEKKVRLLGIDTPEMSDSREDVKLRAFLAKRFSFHHLHGRKVKLTYDWPFEDRYGRLLAYVWTEKTGLFNRFILEKGLAVVFRKYPFKYKEST